MASAIALVRLYIDTKSIDLFLIQGSFLYVIAGIVGSHFKYRVHGSTLGEISFVPYLTALVLYPSWATVALVGFGAALGELRKSKAAVKRVFNVAQFVLAASVSCVLYRYLGGQSIQVQKSFAPLPLSAAVLSFLLVNTVSVAAAIGIAERKSIFKTWFAGSSHSIVYDLAAVPVVYIFARLFVDYHTWGLLATAFIVVGFGVMYSVKHQLTTTNRELLELFVHTVEYGDPYTSGHSQRVSRYSRIISKAVGLSGAEVERISIAALLHDVGKIHEIFRPILTKPGRLTVEERAIMELHPIKSAELVAKLSEFHDIVPAVRHHHENWDGTGYPDRIAGKDIPLGSRIVMFADTIDAMTTDRPYRKALGEAEVRAELSKLSGKQFDPYICEALLKSPYFAAIFTGEETRANRSITQVFDIARRQRSPAVA